MPYKKTYKRTAYKKKSYGAKLNPRQKKEVKRLVAGTTEVKAVDTWCNQSPDAAGSVTKINVPAQGVTVSHRVGDKIHLKKLSFNLNTIVGDTTNIVRLIIFRWTQNDAIAANAPGVTDVLQAGNPTAFYNFTTSTEAKVRVLYDKTLYLSSMGSMDRPYRGMLYGKRLGKKNIEFNAAILTGTDMIYYLLISDSIAATHPSVIGYFRLEYTDA